MPALAQCACHTGRSKRQPHHDAHATSNTFWPRRLDELERIAVGVGELELGRDRGREHAAR